MGKRVARKSRSQERKLVYFFGDGKADGRAHMRNLLGGKGANLAEMSRLGLPVPAGFTITTEVCKFHYSTGWKPPPGLKEQVKKALGKVEKVMGCRFGDRKNPLLVSARSGARSSMPGMMETVLNIGLTTETIPGMIEKTQNPRFVYDAYRRLIMMYADVVMEKAAGIDPADGQGIRQRLERLMEKMKVARGSREDTDLTAEDLKLLCLRFKKKVREVLGKSFPDRHEDQLWGAIGAVFYGLREYGGRVCHRGGLHAQPGHGRKCFLWRVVDQCSG
jgi:pyruvate,orthophosphate dikinase